MDMDRADRGVCNDTYPQGIDGGSEVGMHDDGETSTGSSSSEEQAGASAGAPIDNLLRGDDDFGIALRAWGLATQGKD